MSNLTICKPLQAVARVIECKTHQNRARAFEPGFDTKITDVIRPGEPANELAGQ